MEKLECAHAKSSKTPSIKSFTQKKPSQTALSSVLVQSLLLGNEGDGPVQLTSRKAK